MFLFGRYFCGESHTPISRRRKRGNARATGDYRRARHSFLLSYVVRRSDICRNRMVECKWCSHLSRRRFARDLVRWKLLCRENESKLRSSLELVERFSGPRADVSCSHSRPADAARCNPVRNGQILQSIWEALEFSRKLLHSLLAGSPGWPAQRFLSRFSTCP